MIKYVIVDKGGGVDHLGDDGDHPLALLGLAHLARVHVEGVPDAHRDHRTEALASSVKVVLRHLTKLSVNLRRKAQLLFSVVAALCLSLACQV